MADDLTARARADWPLDDGHRASLHANHCDLCGQRMPCDWSLAVSDVHELANRIEEQQTRIAQLEAELEWTRQAWVNGEDPLCDDVCLTTCKGPCGVFR